MADQQSVFQSLSVVDHAALGCGVVLFVVGAIVLIRRNGWTPSILGHLIKLSISAYAIPKGLYLVYCAFRPELLTQIKDLSLQIIVAGLSAVFLALVAIKSVLWDDATLPPPRT